MSLIPSKRPSDFDSSDRKLISLNTSSSHSLAGIPEISGGFGIRVPLSSTAVTTGPSAQRLTAKHRSRSGEIRAPIAVSEEMSPLTPQSQNISQSGDLMQLLPDVKRMANLSLGPSMSNLLVGQLPKDSSFTSDMNRSTKGVTATTPDGLGDTSFSSLTGGRSRKLQTPVSPDALSPLRQNSAKDLNVSQSRSERTPSVGDDSEVTGLISSMSGAVRRPASFARAVITDTSNESLRRPGASQPPNLATQHEEAVSNIHEVSV